MKSPAEAYGSVFFPRLFPPRRRLPEGPIGWVPFINLALLFILLYLTKAPFVLKPGVTVDLPVAPFTEGLPLNAWVVTVSQEGLVFFHDQRMPLDGLEMAFRQVAREKENSRLIVEADGRVPHQTLLTIYAMASRAGIREVLLATRPAVPATSQEPAP